MKLHYTRVSFSWGGTNRLCPSAQFHPPNTRILQLHGITWFQCWSMCKQITLKCLFFTFSVMGHARNINRKGISTFPAPSFQEEAWKEVHGTFLKPVMARGLLIAWEEPWKRTADKLVNTGCDIPDTQVIQGPLRHTYTVKKLCKKTGTIWQLGRQITPIK